MNAVLSTAISSSSVSSSASCFCGVRWAALRGDTPPPAPGDHSPPGSQSPHGARVATSQPGSTGSGGDEAGAVVGTWWPRRGHLQRWGGGGAELVSHLAVHGRGIKGLLGLAGGRGWGRRQDGVLWPQPSSCGRSEERRGSAGGPKAAVAHHPGVAPGPPTHGLPNRSLLRVPTPAPPPPLVPPQLPRGVLCPAAAPLGRNSGPGWGYWDPHPGPPPASCQSKNKINPFSPSQGFYLMAS